MEGHTKEIKTPRLLLRPYRPDDAEAVFSDWAQDTLVTAHLTWNPHEDISVSRKYCETLAASCLKKGNYDWIITCFSKPIGSIDLVNYFPDGGFEIGYLLGRSFWGQGYMKEAFHAVLSFFFDNEGFSYCLMRYEKGNDRSKRIIVNEGFLFQKEEDVFLEKKSRSSHRYVYRLDKKDFRP